jgi:HAMP domain-containing protein
MTDEHRDALKRVGERLGEASRAAERLAEEVAQSDGPAKPPPAGWQPPDQAQPGGSLSTEIEALLSAVRAMRDLIPPEVVQRLADAVRELLLALRALLDAYIERLEHRQPEPPRVEDIPIQ